MRNKSMFKRNLSTSGILFTISKTGENVKGLLNSFSNKPFISFSLDVDVSTGDIVENSLGEKLRIIDIQPLLDYKNCFYQSEYVYQHDNNAMSTFNINADKIENTIIGTQANATINLEFQIQKMKSDISNSKSSDKDELLKIVSLLEELRDSKEPVPRGILSGFSAVMERNSWFTGAVAGFLLNLFQSQ